MDFIFMLTRNDKTVEDAGCLVDQVCDLGVTHIGFKDLGVPMATMKEVVGAIRRIADGAEAGLRVATGDRPPETLADAYFVAADRRTLVRDSRDYGPVARASIRSIALRVLSAGDHDAARQGRLP